MGIFKDFLLEHYVTIHPDKYDSHEEYEKAKTDFVKDKWDELQHSYKDMGGFAGAKSPEELAKDLHTIKGVKRDGKVVSWRGYKENKFGRKSIVASTDGSIAGKKGYRDISKEDSSQERAYAELSGAPEAIAKKNGTPSISNDHAEKLTGKEILDKDPDGVHFDRLIGGHRHTKGIYGFAAGINKTK